MTDCGDGLRSEAQTSIRRHGWATKNTPKDAGTLVRTAGVCNSRPTNEPKSEEILDTCATRSLKSASRRDKNSYQ